MDHSSGPFLSENEMITIEFMYDKNAFLTAFINYLKNTTIDSWCTDVYRTKDNKNCLFGHLVAFVGDDNCNAAIDIFENLYATTYMVFPVNDGTSETYTQDNPRDRCIAYLQNMLEGKEHTTVELFDICFEEWNKKQTT